MIVEGVSSTDQTCDASERRERATRTERAGGAARENACNGVRGAKPLGNMMSGLLDSLQSQPSVISAELRPPRAELATAASMDAWIDTYHAVKSLTRDHTFVFLTDSAVGLKEEDNLRHLVSNLGSDVPRARQRRRSISREKAI